MSPRTEAQLQQQFPGQWWLGIDEVAAVLGAASRGRKQVIRGRMQDGTYPGAQKHGGRWKLPLVDLAEILEPTPNVGAPVLPAPVVSGGGKRRAAALGPRISALRSAGFWSRVAEALGWEQEAQLLDKAVRDMLQALVDEAAEAQAARFDSKFAPAENTAKPKPPIRI